MRTSIILFLCSLASTGCEVCLDQPELCLPPSEGQGGQQGNPQPEEPRILEMVWTPDQTVYSDFISEEGVYVDQVIPFELPPEVESLYAWVSCWHVSVPYLEEGFFTTWMVGQPVPVDQIAEGIRIQIEVPEGTLACQWEIYGQCAGQGIPQENPDGENFFRDFCWQSIYHRFDNHDHFQRGTHQWRFLSPEETDLNMSRDGSYHAVGIHAYVPVLPDRDRDGVLDDDDNCPDNWGFNDEDMDGDGTDDACDSDMDNDGVPNSEDNCVADINPDQTNTDGDWFGDVCDLEPERRN